MLDHTWRKTFREWVTKCIELNLHVQGAVTIWLPIGHSVTLDKVRIWQNSLGWNCEINDHPVLRGNVWDKNFVGEEVK